LPARARILAGGIAKNKPAEGLDVAAEIQTARVLAGAALGVSMQMDYDVNALRFSAKVVPYDDEVRAALAAVCGEERYAVHFQMSAFPGALTGGLAGGVLRDFALRIGGGGVGGRRLGFGCGSSVWCISGRGVRWRSFWRRGVGKPVVHKRCCLRGRLGAAGSTGAKRLNRPTIEAAIRG
jgi:hypothetical protein